MYKLDFVYNPSARLSVLRYQSLRVLNDGLEGYPMCGAARVRHDDGVVELLADPLPLRWVQMPADGRVSGIAISEKTERVLKRLFVVLICGELSLQLL